MRASAAAPDDSDDSDEFADLELPAVSTFTLKGAFDLFVSIRLDRDQPSMMLAATIAADLLAWLRLLCLDGPPTKAEPKTLRYRLLHTAARIIRSQRKRKIKIPATWPFADPLAACLRTALALPPPSRETRPRPPTRKTSPDP